MEYRTENFLTPAAAAAVAAHQPYHYFNQQSSPYAYSPYHNTGHVGGGSGSSASTPTNPSAFFGASPVSQYNAPSLASASGFPAGLSRYTGKFSTGLSKLTSPGSTVAPLYPGSGLATLVASGSYYTGSKDFAEEIITIPTSQSQNSSRSNDKSENSYEESIAAKRRSSERSPKPIQPSPGPSADSPDTIEGKCRIFVCVCRQR